MLPCSLSPTVPAPSRLCACSPLPLAPPLPAPFRLCESLIRHAHIALAARDAETVEVLEERNGVLPRDAGIAPSSRQRHAGNDFLKVPGSGPPWPRAVPGARNADLYQRTVRPRAGERRPAPFLFHLELCQDGVNSRGLEAADRNADFDLYFEVTSSPALSVGRWPASRTCSRSTAVFPAAGQSGQASKQRWRREIHGQLAP